MRKNIDIPSDSIKVLEELARLDGRPVKNYMERVLIGHANDYYQIVKSVKKKKVSK